MERTEIIFLLFTQHGCGSGHPRRSHLRTVFGVMTGVQASQGQVPLYVTVIVSKIIIM